MTVQIDWHEQGVKFQVHGDIYEEQAECLHDMVQSHVRRGIKAVDIELCTTYYISRKGQQCLRRLQNAIGCCDVRVSLAK
jgi:hypothetical protein